MDVSISGSPGIQGTNGASPGQAGTAGGPGGPATAPNSGNGADATNTSLATGGQGYTPALPIERHLRDARAGAVMAPTNAVLPDN